MPDEILETEDSLILDESDDLQTNKTEEKLKKAEEIALNQKIRAERAEKELKDLKSKPQAETTTPKNDENFTLKDIRALNTVHDDDVEDVVDYAKYKKITPAEALKTPAVINLLKAKEEERKTALATNTGTGKRGTSQKSDERVLDDFNQGKISESDDDINRLAEARFNSRKARR